jgi:excisionase family DNA binding protein
MTAPKHGREVGIGKVAERLGLSPSRVRQLASEGVIPSTTTRGGHRRFDLADAVEAWTRHRGVASQAGAPTPTPRWRHQYDLEGLAEDKVWAEAKAAAPELGEHLRAQRIMAYAVTEMVNNAIDHSDGNHVDVRLWLEARTARVVIADDGVGAFARVRAGFDLESELAAVAELTKGKRTTDPTAHTGEGIFFTSKAVDLFGLESNGIRWIVDNEREDEAVGTSPVTVGTTVRLRIDLDTTRDLTGVFRGFSVDHDFVRTRPVIRLFELGTEFVSRSEAKRLLAGLESFRHVELDFRGVESVGQAFVDEVFRVWARANPDTDLIPIGMNDAVRFMIERGLPGSDR